MNKNLFLLAALCAVTAQSCASDERGKAFQSSLLWRAISTVEGNPVRLSTHYPVVRDACGSVGTPVVDAALALFVGAAVVYGGKSAYQSPTVRSGAACAVVCLKDLGKGFGANPGVAVTSAAATGLAATLYHRNVIAPRHEAALKDSSDVSSQGHNLGAMTDGQ